jgi:hypothetical protein
MPKNCWPNLTTARLAGTGQADAEKLDRQEPRRAYRLPYRLSSSPSGKRSGNEGESPAFSGCSPRAPILLLGATYVAVAAEHPLALHAAQSNPELWPLSSMNAGSGGVTEAELATQEKKGMPTGLTVTHPLDRRSVAAVGRQLRADGLRRRRGDGCARPRRARFRLCPSIRFADQAGHPHQRRRLTRPHPGATLTPITASVLIPANTTASTFDAGVDAIAADLNAKGLGEKKVTWRLRDWGHFPATLLGNADPDHSLRILWRRSGPGRAIAGGVAGPSGPGRLRQSAQQISGILSTAPVRNAASRRGARPTPWTPSWIRPGTFSVTARRARARWSTLGPIIGCRWINTSAASSTPSCICCIPGSGPRSCAIWGLTTSSFRAVSPIC